MALAFLLRVIGIGFGLPDIYHQDEPIIVNHAMAIGVGGWNTHFFVVPPFTIYFLFLLYGTFFSIGKVFGIFNTAKDFGLLFMHDPSFFYIWGRFFIGVIFGVLTVWAVWFLAKRFFSEKSALWAAFLLAIMPFHVQHSHYIYADIPLTLAVVGMLFMLLLIVEKPSALNYVSFGAFTGWAISIKYTALYFVPVLLLAHFLSKKNGSLKWNSLVLLLGSGIASLFVFALFAPFTFIDFKECLNQLTSQTGAEGSLGLWHHLGYSIIGGTGILFIAFCFTGAALILRRSATKARLVITFIIIYYAVNVYFTQSFARYMLPLTPVLAILAGIAIEGLWTQKGVTFFVKYVLVSALSIELIAPTLYADLLYARKDTRTQCAEWFDKEAHPGSVVVVDNRFFGPHLLQSEEQIRQKFGLLDASEKNGARKARLDLMLQSIQGQKTYNVYQLAGMDQRSSKFLFLQPYADLSVEGLKKIGAKYLVINYADSGAETKEFVQKLLPKFELVQSFSPYRDAQKKYTVDPYDLTAAPHLPMEIFSRKSLGPYLEVYRIKNI